MMDSKGNFRFCAGAVPLLIVLTGCGFTSEGTMIRDRAEELGAQAMDKGLSNAEWFICQAASIGSVRRRYGRVTETADAYRNLCATNAAELLPEAADGS